jgi:hypothetical protein
MSITLFCLVKGSNTTANAFEVDTEKGHSVSRLKKVIKEEKPNDFAGIDANNLKLWKVEISGDHDDQLRTLILQDSNQLSALNDIGDYWSTSPPKKHIHVIIKLPCKCLVQSVIFRHLPS